MIQRRVISLILFTTGFSFQLGCSHQFGVLGVDCCADIPAGAIPPPAGNKLCDWQTAQVTSAVADQTMLYQCDFVDRTDKLSPAALLRLSRHSNTELAVTQSWFIEPSGDDTLDTARVTSLLGELALLGIESADVQVAHPAALGLSGPLAERVASRYGSNRNTNGGTGAPISRPAGMNGFGAGFSGGFQ